MENLNYYFYVKFVNIVNLQYIEGNQTTYIEYRIENCIFSDNRKGGKTMSLESRQACRNLREYNKFIEGLIGGCDYDFSDKKNCINTHIRYMLNRTQSMFKWTGLPDTIPQRALELIIQCNGCAAFYKYNGQLYAFSGGLGGEPNPYYMPTIFTIANPALKLSVNAEIDKDCIVVPNDAMYLGLLPLFSKYATSLTENELSIIVALINSRIPALISSDNDSATKSAEKYISDIKDGKLGVIASQAFFEGIKTQPYGATSNSNIITNLIESQQYMRATWFNDLGLNANYNMKRESINSGESQLNDDALLPLVDNMLECRKIAVEKINAMFGMSISVDLSSAWEDNKIELENAQDEIENSDNWKDDGGEDNELSETSE